MEAGKPKNGVKTAGAVNPGEPAVRTFVAVELPEHIRAVLGELQGELKSCGLFLRWTRPENIHLTLKFLGDVPQSALSGLADAVSEIAAAHGPVILSVRSIGVFPNIRRPNVLWTGIAGQMEALTMLQKDLDVRLCGLLGISPEKRRFVGHLTLGRVNGRPDPKRFIAVMEKFGGLETEAFTVDAVCLFVSKLLPSGPVYTKIRKAALGFQPV